MSHNFKILFAIAVALFESSMVAMGTWIENVDFVFILLLAFFIQAFGWAEILSFFAASLIIESVSMAPFGVYALAVGLVIVIGRILFQTVFTQRSLYSLLLLSVSLSFIFSVIMSVIEVFISFMYNASFGLSLNAALIGFILNTIVLFFLFMLQVRRTERKYLSL